MLGSSSSKVLAQTPVVNPPCGFDYKMEKHLSDPQNKAAYDAFTAKYANLAHTASVGPPTEYFIPYVIHDIYESATDKVTATSMGLLMARLQISLDLILAPHNVKITLVKAFDCDALYAFKQKQVIPSSDADNTVFLSSRLPTKKYLNIWFLQELKTAPGVPNAAAYSNLPSSTGTITDGIVLSKPNYFFNLTNFGFASGQEHSNFIENSPYVASRSLGQNIMTTYGSFFMPDYQAVQAANDGEIESPVESKIAKIPTIMVAPNPAKDFTRFYWNSDKITGNSLMLFISDATGKQLLSNIVAKESSNYEWNTSNLSEGIYFYQVLLDNGQTLQSGKIVVQK
jgi:hypothetical protein